MRQVFIARDGKWVPREEAYGLCGPRVHVITDEMSPTWHPIDGKHYTSKSEFHKTTRAHGCDCIGNEHPDKAFGKRQDYEPRGVKDSILKVMEQRGYR